MLLYYSLENIEISIFLGFFALACVWLTILSVYHHKKRAIQQRQLAIIKQNQAIENEFREKAQLPKDMTTIEACTRIHLFSLENWMGVMNGQFGQAADIKLKLASKINFKIPPERYAKMKLRSGREIQSRA